MIKKGMILVDKTDEKFTYKEFTQKLKYYIIQLL